MTTCREILAWCDDILQTAQFKDYAPNGLQVEGAEKIEKIVAAVTASRAAVEKPPLTAFPIPVPPPLWSAIKLIPFVAFPAKH